MASRLDFRVTEWPPTLCSMFFFLMIRRPPRSTLDRSSAASDVYKRQPLPSARSGRAAELFFCVEEGRELVQRVALQDLDPVSYTHLRAHETVLDLVCRLLLEKKKKTIDKYNLL